MARDVRGQSLTDPDRHVLPQPHVLIDSARQKLNNDNHQDTTTGQKMRLWTTTLLASVSLSLTLAIPQLSEDQVSLIAASTVVLDGTVRNVSYMNGIVEWDGPLSTQVPILTPRVRARSEESEGDDEASVHDEDDDQDEVGEDDSEALFDVADRLYTVGDDQVVEHEKVKRDTVQSNSHVNDLEKRRRKKHGHRNGHKGGKTAVITWYDGVDLQNPYCGSRSGWTPTDNSLVTAPTLQWGKNKPPCGAFIQLRAPNSNRAVIVRVWDACGGCQPNVPHLDLTRRAFKALYPINVGKVKGVQWSYVGQPFKKWGRQQVAMYGPKQQ
ncbi:hypothetical protein OIV83_003157 [Microbotryomycetes sp. JL201]|nr:hypothetical protein OIV83_003157 [Microbotryomycetes sp. JL201]